LLNAESVDSLTVLGQAGNDDLRSAPALRGRVRLTLNGEAGNDTLFGSAILIGGADSDTVDFSTTSAVSYNMDAVGVPQSVNGEVTLITGDLIENVRGSLSGDLITGQAIASARVIDGNGGNDAWYINTLGAPSQMLADGLVVPGFAPVSFYNLEQATFTENSIAHVDSLVHRLESAPRQSFRQRLRLFRRFGLRRFRTSIVLRNDSQTLALTGPLTIVVFTKPGVRVVNPLGQATTKVAPGGSTALTLGVGQLNLQPGQEQRYDVFLQFTARALRVRANHIIRVGAYIGNGPF
jgi:hypothetical protein